MQFRQNPDQIGRAGIEVVRQRTDPETAQNRTTNLVRVAAFDGAAKRANVPLKVIRDGFDGGREQYERRLMLVRPDQYLVWAGDGGAADAADAANVMARVVGRG